MTKIEALEKTIYNLENDVYEYNWSHYEQCNCGVLAASIIGDGDVRKYGIGSSPAIRGLGASGEYYCMTTDLPLPKVFQSVKDCGFTYQEMIDLEVFSNDKIRDAGGLFYGEYKKKESLIKYLKAWVEILKEEKLNSEQEVKECDATMSKKVETVGSKIIHVYHKVEVPESIQSSLPETILS